MKGDENRYFVLNKADKVLDPPQIASDRNKNHKAQLC